MVFMLAPSSVSWNREITAFSRHQDDHAASLGAARCGREGGSRGLLRQVEGWLGRGVDDAEPAAPAHLRYREVEIGRLHVEDHVEVGAVARPRPA